MFLIRNLFSIFSFVVIYPALSLTVQASEITDVIFDPTGDQLNLSWQAYDEDWHAVVNRDTFLGDSIPVITVSVSTGDEELTTTLPNVYFRGALKDTTGSVLANTTVYVDQSNDALPFTGFVAKGNDLYIIEADATSSTGIRMRLEQTANDVTGGSAVLDSRKGWGKGGKGGALNPANLISRNTTTDNFPSLDIYVDPSYIASIGESNYVARILQNLAVANTIYAQSNLKQIHLSAIVLPDEDIAHTSSQGSILHGLERLRKYTVQTDSTDSSMVYSGEIFNQPSLWGWSEVGFGCELQQAVTLGNNINTHQIGKAAFAVIDLPSLMQRGWIFAHEASHTLGGGHIAGDPLSDGAFQPELALKDYVATCEAKKLIYHSCAFDPQTKAFTDFYSCDM